MNNGFIIHKGGFMLSDTINTDIKDAMIKKEKERLDALRYLKAMLIENKTSKTPIEEMDVLIKHVKKLKDSLVNFPEGNDVRTRTEKEISFLTVYMPKELTEEEVIAIIDSILQATPGANQGIVMKELTPKIKGQFDGKRASELVKNKIS